MTKPVNDNFALIPAFKSRWKNENNKEEDPKVWGYAPPGSSFRAKLRTLPIDDSEPVEVIEDSTKKNGNGHKIVQMNKKNGDETNEITLKIDAVVTVIGKLPEEGIAVETVTLLRPADKKAKDA